MQGETVQPQEKSLDELLAEAQAKLEEQREQMLRALAETENVRKRLQVEAANAQKYALERFADSLLPVVDSLEAAVNTAAVNTPAVNTPAVNTPDVSGIEVILRQLKAALEKGSIREINPAPGERFDPHRAQAMAAVEAPPGEMREPNTIVAVLQKGYSLHDRVLRPALVTVAKPPVEKQAENPISNTDLN